MDRVFTLEALPAGKGDCLILHYGDSDSPRLCVVDGGPGGVYAQALRPRLEAIRDSRDLDFGETLFIDLLMVSHVDDDHINGVLDLADELINSDEGGLPLVRVDTLWHNSFDEIIGNQELDTDSAEASALASFGDAGLPSDADHDAAHVLASIRQGHKLRNAATVLDWAVNSPFDALVLDGENNAEKIDLFGGGLKITVLGPQKDELKKLQKKYDDFLRDKGLGREAPQGALAAISKDRSVANLSSIVALMECDGKSILLTGDARGDHILEGLGKRGLATEDNPFFVDVLKMQHHGSERNVSPEFFRRIKARHYVFCGNGKHGNPERLTIEWLFNAHDGDPITLHFTHGIAKIDAEREAHERKHDKSWEANNQALATLLEDERQGGRDFEVCTPSDQTGVRIDLLRRLGT
ncbi:hypothetical protein [Pseudophaeobacter sp.]|uniref:hypothetical protein n=1 Tax=Pseudophaeobacter sp. TaxID=1971739 RepID=UPI00329761A4